jgi:hypothetical protein
MLECLIIVGVAIAAGVMILLWLDMADVAIDLVSSLAQLLASIVALFVSLLVLAFNALRRLLKKQHNALLP